MNITWLELSTTVAITTVLFSIAVSSILGVVVLVFTAYKFLKGDFK